VVFQLAFMESARATDWFNYESSEFRFAVQFPAEPKVNSASTTAISLQAESPATGMVYDAGVEVLPLVPSAAITEASLIAGRDGAVREINGKLISDCEIRIDGHPGREFAAIGENNEKPVLICFRVFVIGNRLYRLHVTRLGSVTADLESAMQFFGSFRNLEMEQKIKTQQKVDDYFKGIPYGEWASMGHLQFRIKNAAIQKVRVDRRIYNDYYWTNETFLVVTLEIRNVDERRIAYLKNYRSSDFGLFDDVKNVIRRIDFGLANTPAGKLARDAAINPGATISAVECFSHPPADFSPLAGSSGSWIEAD